MGKENNWRKMRTKKLKQTDLVFPESATKAPSVLDAPSWGFLDQAVWGKSGISLIMVSCTCWFSPIVMHLGSLVGLQRWTVSICFLRKSFGRKTRSMQMWKPYYGPESCKWRSKKINTTLYPFLVLCFCMECKECYLNVTNIVCGYGPNEVGP